MLKSPKGAGHQEMAEERRAQRELVEEEVERLRRRVTELEAVEERCRQAEERLHGLEQAISGKGATSAGGLVNLGSEFRMALDGIIGMTELVLETKLSIKQRQDLETVQLSAERLLLVMTNLLDLAGVEADQFELDRIAFGLRDCIGYTMGTLALRGRARQVEVVCRILPEVPETVTGDPAVIRQIVANLVSHAIESAGRGVVMLRIELGWQTVNEAHVRFAVVFSGEGLLVEAGQKMFESAVESQRNGVSLGAAGAAELNLRAAVCLVKALGGDIEIQSDMGKSLTILYTLPVGLQQENVVVPAPPMRPESITGLSVLIVDENLTNRRILQGMLTNWRVRPQIAGTAEEALVAMQRTAAAGMPFPLVLISASLPQMDGFALARRIKSESSLAETRLVLLASSGQRGDAARCRKLGIAGYLTRPLRQSDLFDALMTVLAMPARCEGKPFLVTRHSLRENRRILRILFVQDNIINQTLVVRILEARGHIVLVAGSNHELLALLKQQSFDVMIIDWGLIDLETDAVDEALTAIKRAAGTAVRILAAGHRPPEALQGAELPTIDGRIPLPFQARDLVDIVEVVTAPIAETAEALQPKRLEDQPDRAAIVSRLDGDLKLLRDIAALFLTEYPVLFAGVRKAISHHDTGILRHVTGTLQAALENFSVQTACGLARKLETLACAGDLAGAEAVCDELEAEVTRLRPQLQGLGRSIEV